MTDVDADSERVGHAETISRKVGISETDPGDLPGHLDFGAWQK
jgi:hypothetical protein